MKISVYITSYNQKKYLIEAIESVLAQTLKPFQIIIIDDCSTDGSQDIISSYHKKYPELIIPVYHKENTGIAKTRIDALQIVKGDYVTFLDGDDRFLPTKLEKEIRILKENKDAQIVFSNFFYIDENGTRKRIWAEHKKPPVGYVFSQTFARDFPRQTLFRSELVDYRAWKRIGFHDTNLSIYEDYDMRIRLTKQLKVAYCDEPLSEYRIHGDGLSRCKAIHHLETIKYIYRKNMPLLNDVNDEERNYVKGKLDSLLADIALKVSREFKQEKQNLLSIKYLFYAILSDPSILMNNVIPSIFHIRSRERFKPYLADSKQDYKIKSK